MSQNKLDESTVLTGFIWGIVIASLIALYRLPEQVLRRRQQIIDPKERELLLRRVDPVTSSIDEGRALAAERHRGR